MSDNQEEKLHSAPESEKSQTVLLPGKEDTALIPGQEERINEEDKEDPSYNAIPHPTGGKAERSRIHPEISSSDSKTDRVKVGIT